MEKALEEELGEYLKEKETCKEEIKHWFLLDTACGVNLWTIVLSEPKFFESLGSKKHNRSAWSRSENAPLFDFQRSRLHVHVKHNTPNV